MRSVQNTISTFLTIYASISWRGNKVFGAFLGWPDARALSNRNNPEDCLLEAAGRILQQLIERQFFLFTFTR